MNLLYAFLIVLLVYPGIGTLLFALLKNLKASLKLKIIILNLAHPALTAAIIWVVCSTFSREIAETGVLLTCGSLLGLFSSKIKYFSNLVKEPDSITIEYMTELLRRKEIKINISEIKEFSQSRSQRFFDQPSELTVTVDAHTLTFKILDKQVVASL